MYVGRCDLKLLKVQELYNNNPQQRLIQSCMSALDSTYSCMEVQELQPMHRRNTWYMYVGFGFNIGLISCWCKNYNPQEHLIHVCLLWIQPKTLFLIQHWPIAAGARTTTHSNTWYMCIPALDYKLWPSCATKILGPTAVLDFNCFLQTNRPSRWIKPCGLHVCMAWLCSDHVVIMCILFK